MVVLDSEAAGTLAVKQVQPKAAWKELMELVSSVQQSRARVVVLERGALSCIKQMSKTCGSEDDTAAFAKHEACWASHSSLLRSWDEAVAANVTELQAVLQKTLNSKVCTEGLTSHTSSNVPCETKTLKLEAKDYFDTVKGENTTKSGPSPKKPELTSETTRAAPGSVPSPKEPKLTNESTPAPVESTNVTWAGRIRASLSPNQTGAVGRAHKVLKTQAKAADVAAPPLPVATSGTIVKLVKEGGYGFLAPDGGGGDIFFHASVCDTYFDAMKVGDRATSTITTQASGKAAATAVRVLQPSPTAATQVAPVRTTVRTTHQSTACKTAKPAATKMSTVPRLSSWFQGLQVSRHVKKSDPAAKPLPTKASAGTSPDKVAKPRAADPSLAMERAREQLATVMKKELEQRAQQRARQRNIQDSWPKPRTGEIELIIDEPLSYAPRQKVRSGSLDVQHFKFNILAFPNGTGSKMHPGKSFGAFVEALPGDVEPDSLFHEVCFEITAVNWSDFSKSRTKSTSFTFKASGLDIDCGWHEMLTREELERGGCWIGPAGSVCIRARCMVDDKATWS